MSYVSTNACMYISHTRDLVSACVQCIYGLVRARGGGRVYEIKTLCSNLAPEEGMAFIREGRIIEQVQYVPVALCLLVMLYTYTHWLINC